MPEMDAETGSVDVVIEDERWQAAGLEALAARAARATLDHLGLDAEIVVMGCDDARIAELNGDFRGKDKATNVLSWPAVEHVPHEPGAIPPLAPTEELGDIAIAYETCLAEAEAQGKTMDDHVVHLLCHAILHLAGYDHIHDEDARLMEDTERKILSTLGIPDPYQEKDL